jgi:hypothetical protein
VLQEQEAAPQLGPDLGGAWRRLHAVRPAKKQFILQGVPEAVEGVADGGLGQAQPFSGAGDASFLGEGVEHAQQIEIEALKMNFPHFRRDDFSFESYNISF